jgi:peptidoglycan hydrolase-like protein with peptidoglycan-binding domain
MNVMSLRVCLVVATLALAGCAANSKNRDLGETGAGATGAEAAVTTVSDGTPRGAAAGEVDAGLTDAEEQGADERTRLALYVADSGLIATTQAGLIKLGYDPGPVDGLMGARTSAAIRAYQIDQGLRVDGAPTPDLERHILGQFD